MSDIILHGPIALPSGVVATGVLLHELRTTLEDEGFEYKDNQGQFDGGKSLRHKRTLALSGEALTTLALPTIGTGNGASDSTPHIDKTEVTQKSEGAADFSIDAHSYEAGSGIWS
jgi:hypothetical protein